MERYIYEAVLTPVKGIGYEVEFPQLGLITQGKDLADAAYMAQDLLHVWVSGELEDGNDVPTLGTFCGKAPENSVVMAVMTMAGPGSANVDEMTADEAADILGVSRARVYAMARDGILESRKVGSSVMISTDSVRERFGNPGKPGRPKTEELMQM